MASVSTTLRLRVPSLSQPRAEKRAGSGIEKQSAGETTDGTDIDDGTVSKSWVGKMYELGSNWLYAPPVSQSDALSARLINETSDGMASSRPPEMLSKRSKDDPHNTARSGTSLITSDQRSSQFHTNSSQASEQSADSAHLSTIHPRRHGLSRQSNTTSRLTARDRLTRKRADRQLEQDSLHRQQYIVGNEWSPKELKHETDSHAESIDSASTTSSIRVVPKHSHDEEEHDMADLLQPPKEVSREKTMKFNKNQLLPVFQKKVDGLSPFGPEQTIGASLRWSKKFPSGRHLKRAQSSRLSLNSGLRPSVGSYLHHIRKQFHFDETQPTQTMEVRRGLRFLAQREDDPYSELDHNKQERLARWRIFKWVLFISVLTGFLYGLAGITCCLLTWARGWQRAEISAIVDMDILILLSLASLLCLLTSVIGLCGTILNSRPILSLYAFLLWPTLLSMLAVGYTSYRRANLRLDRKLNMAWSRYFTQLDRLRLQNNLRCCGYYSPLHQATFSRTCYPRTNLPGCKGKLYLYESKSLRQLYTVVFSLVFVHLGNIAASLLCSNHVNESFGKGLTPRAYRLDRRHVEEHAQSIISYMQQHRNQMADKKSPLHGAWMEEVATIPNEGEISMHSVPLEEANGETRKRITGLGVEMQLDYNEAKRLHSQNMLQYR